MKKSRRYKKESKKFSHGKVIVPITLALIFAVSSLMMTVMAATVEATVIDGDDSYMVSVMGDNAEQIINQAVSDGMPMLEGEDRYFETDDNTYVIDREILIPLEVNNDFSYLSAYGGQTVQEVLTGNNITINENDLVNPELNKEVDEDDSINIQRQLSVSLGVDGTTLDLTTYKTTVEELLLENEVEILEGDEVSPEKETALEEGMKISVTRLWSVELQRGGETTAYDTYANTVGEFLSENKIELAEDENVSVDLDAKLSDGMTIIIASEYTVEETETSIIYFKTEYKTDSTLEVGEEIVEKKGVNGELTTTYERTYKDGELVNEEELSSEITKEAEDAIVIRGTMVTEDTSSSEEEKEPEEDAQLEEDEEEEEEELPANSFIDYNGNVVTYSQKMTGECTAYSTKGTTSTGVPSQVGVVAVNPNVIPYGTKLYIVSPGGGVVYGYAVAGDTGGAMMSGAAFVDLFYNTDAECFQFGRRQMDVYILD